MPRLLTMAGGASLLGAAAHEGGFLPGALLSLLTSDRDEEDPGFHRRFLRDHWNDVKGPFYLFLFGVGLLMIAQQVGRAAAH
jgi:hypothetical protein